MRPSTGSASSRARRWTPSASPSPCTPPSPTGWSTPARRFPPGGVPTARGAAPAPGPARFLGFTPEQVTTLTERMPYLARAAIRPGVYRGQDMPIGTLQMWNAAIVHKDMPEDFVYELVKTIFSNRDFLESVYT